MGESLMSRRGGGGSVSKSIGIYTGTAPPGDKYGVYASTTNTITNKIVTSNTIAPGGAWNAVGNTAGTAVGYYTGIVSNGNLIYGCKSASSQRLFQYDTISNTSSISSLGLVESGCIAHWEGTVAILFRANYAPYKYDYSSNVGTSMAARGLEDVCNSASRYGNTIFIAGGTTVLAAWKYSPSSDSFSLFYKESVANPYDRAYLGFTTYSGNRCYISGGRITNNINYTNYYIDMDTANVGNTTSKGLGTSSGTSLYGGFMINNKIYALYNNSAGFVSLDINNISAGWVSEIQVPFIAVNQHGCTINGIGYSTNGSNTTVLKFTPKYNSFPGNTLVVQSSVGNQATIYKDNKIEITIPVSGVYYSNGTTLIRLSGQTRVSGGAWTAIP